MTDQRSAVEPGAEAPGSPVVAFALLAGVFLIPVLASVRPVSDWDIWWHLRTGQWIVENNQVTTNDPFSAYGADKPWLAYSWLFEVLVWKLYAAFGLAGIVVYRVLLATAVVWGFLRIALRFEPRFLLATLMAAVAGLAIIPLISERPWLFTILFTTLTLEVVLDLRRGERRWTFWALPLCYVLWANIHIQFVYGFLILGLGVVAPFLDRKPMPNWKSLLALSFVCALATLVNPYGVKLYIVVLEYATQQTPFNVVDELRAMEFRDHRDWIVLGLAMLTAFALGRKKDLSAFEILLFAVSVFLCFRARRDLWMIVLAALVILPSLTPSTFLASPVYAVSRGVQALAVGFILLLALLLGMVRGLTEVYLRQKESEKFPTQAVEFIAEKGYEGPIYNHFNLGGYLIWKLPGLPVSMDGRTNLHGEERIKRAINVWSAGQDWDRDEELQKARIVFAYPDSALTAALRRDSRFRVDYEDKLAVVFIRNR